MLRTALMGLAVMAAFPAHAEVVQKSENGFVVRTTTDVAKAPLEAWAALVAPAKWWNKEHTWSGDAANLYMDAQAGGCFCEQLALPADAPAGTRRGSVEHMRIIHTNPGKVLRLSGSLGPLQGEAVTGTLSITLKPIAGGTRILFEYVVGGYMRFKTDDIAPAVDAMLSEQLHLLGEYIGPLSASAAVTSTPQVDTPKN